MTKRECVSKPVFMSFLFFPFVLFYISLVLYSFQLSFKLFYHICFINCSSKWIFFQAHVFQFSRASFEMKFVCSQALNTPSPLCWFDYSMFFDRVCASFWSWAFFWMRLNEWKVYLLVCFTFLLYFFSFGFSVPIWCLIFIWSCVANFLRLKLQVFSFMQVLCQSLAS